MNISLIIRADLFAERGNYNKMTRQKMRKNVIRPQNYFDKHAKRLFDCKPHDKMREESKIVYYHRKLFRSGDDCRI